MVFPWAFSFLSLVFDYQLCIIYGMVKVPKVYLDTNSTSLKFAEDLSLLTRKVSFIGSWEVINEILKGLSSSQSNVKVVEHLNFWISLIGHDNNFKLLLPFEETYKREIGILKSRRSRCCREFPYINVNRSKKQLNSLRNQNLFLDLNTIQEFQEYMSTRNIRKMLKGIEIEILLLRLSSSVNDSDFKAVLESLRRPFIENITGYQTLRFYNKQSIEKYFKNPELYSYFNTFVEASIFAIFKQSIERNSKLDENALTDAMHISCAQTCDFFCN